MASTVRKVLQYSPGSTGVLFASDCSTFRRGLEDTHLMWMRVSTVNDKKEDE